MAPLQTGMPCPFETALYTFLESSVNILRTLSKFILLGVLLFVKMPWRRAWQPTPVFLPGEAHGHSSPAGCSPWGREESDTTEAA